MQVNQTDSESLVDNFLRCQVSILAATAPFVCLSSVKETSLFETVATILSSLGSCLCESETNDVINRLTERGLIDVLVTITDGIDSVLLRVDSHVKELVSSYCYLLNNLLSQSDGVVEAIVLSSRLVEQTLCLYLN